jgi:hypothetical protein
VDLLIDWKSQRVTVFVDGKERGSNIFFVKPEIKVNNANALMLYNLSPGGHCIFEKIKVCEKFCDVDGYEVDFAFAKNISLMAAAMVTMVAVLV